MNAIERIADHGQLAVDLMRAAVNPGMCPADLVESMTGMAIVHAQAAWRGARKLNEAAAFQATTCPGCSGAGVLTDDPQVLRCERCGGVFTNPRFQGIIMEQAIRFVAVHQPMLANAGTDGAFYFDLFIVRPSDGGQQRMHGWADKATKRVVQWG